MSGLEIMALSTMKGLQARGHTVRCLTNAWNDGNFHERLEEAGIPYRPIPLGMVSKSLEWKHIKVIHVIDVLHKPAVLRERLRKLADWLGRNLSHWT